MDEKQLKRIFWNEAATGGLIVGLVIVAIYFADYALSLGYSKASFMTNVLFFGAIVAGLIVYGRRMAKARGNAGFTYGQAIGFSLVLMMFVGVISGLGQFVLQTYIDPDYYKALFEHALMQSGIKEDMIEKMLEARDSGITSNPAYMVFGGIIGTVIMGGFVSLFTSIFTKKATNPFAEDAAETEAEFIEKMEDETAEVEELKDEFGDKKEDKDNESV